MKRAITLKLDTELLRKARILAAETDTSISALLTQQLERAVREREGYEQQKRRALAVLRRGFRLDFTPPRSRDELYER